jgi:hypothetical protein
VKSTVARYWKWLLIGLIVLGLLIQFGGMTVVVVNHALMPICEVHVSTMPEMQNWGPNRIRNPIPSPQSRDVHLPLYMNIFKTGDDRVFYVWAVDCDGKLINQSFHTGKGSLFLWEVTRQSP